jgi:hypothetical protein
MELWYLFCRRIRRVSQRSKNVEQAEYLAAKARGEEVDEE